MATKVNVLFNGYSKMSGDDPNVMYANCTCTLIRSTDLTIIVDTMTPWDRSDILAGTLASNIFFS